MTKTKEELKQQSNETFYDNNVGGIIPSKHRAFNDDLIDGMATNEQGSKADTAIQTAKLNGVAVPKVGTELQFPDLATKADGEKAATAIQSAKLNGTAVPKVGTELQFPDLATKTQGDKADTAIQSATLNGAAVPKSGTAFQFPDLATKAQGTKADTAIQTATINGVAVPKVGTQLQFPEIKGQEFATFVVDSDAALAAWANNTAGNDYSVVLIKKGTWTGNKGINFEETKTRRVYGEPESELVINPVNGEIFCITMSTDAYIIFPMETDYSMSGVTVSTSNADINNSIFLRCHNMINCTAKYTGTTEYTYVSNAKRGFFRCRRLVNCTAIQPKEKYGFVGFYFTHELVNCTADGGSIGYYACHQLSSLLAVSNFYSEYIAYLDCSNVSSCYVQSAGIAYKDCSMMSSCDSLMSEIGYSGCSHLSSCRATGGETPFVSSKFLTSCWGTGGRGFNFTNCTNMLNNYGSGIDKYSNCKVTEGGAAVSSAAAGGFNV